MEPDKLAAFAGKGQHTTERTQQSSAIYSEQIGIILRDYRIIIRITPFDKSARENAAGILNFSIAFVEFNDHIAAVFT